VLNSGKAEKQVFVRPIRRPDRISGYFRREWKTLLIVAASGTLFNMGQSLCAVRQGKLVDAIADNAKGSGADIAYAALTFFFTVLAVQLLRLAKRYYVRRFANAADITMRMMVYNHMVHEDLSSLCSENSGEVMTRALGDVDRTVEGMRKVTTEVFDTGVLLVTYYLVMLHYSIPCTVLSCLPVPIALLAARFLKKYVEKYNRRSREISADVAEKSLDAVKNSMLYRVTGSSGRVADAYEQELFRLEKAETGAGILENSMQPLYNAVALCGSLAVIFFGGRLVLSQAWTVGTFTAYLTIYLAFALKVAKVSKLFNTCQKARVSWMRVKPYLTEWTEDDEEEEEKSSVWKTGRLYAAEGHGEAGLMAAKAADRMTAAAGRSGEDFLHERERETSIVLLCREVTVSADGKKDLISPVSFAGSRGQIIGITGAVASGKSLLAQAIAGLHGYKGVIRICGRDLGILTQKERAEKISFMGHDPQLFDLSLKDNILLGRTEDTARIREVIGDVCFDEDLKTMTEGLSSMTGSEGKTLSGGQRARISLARTLYARTPVIILDDPFANVDGATEAAMIGKLREHYKGSLLIITSHRMKIFEEADLVLMIEDGGFVRVGNHESLMQESKEYRADFMAQMAETGRNTETVPGEEPSPEDIRMSEGGEKDGKAE